MRSSLCLGCGILFLVLIQSCTSKSNPTVPPPEPLITSISGTVYLPDSLASSAVYIGFAHHGAEIRPDPSWPDRIRLAPDPGIFTVDYRYSIPGTIERNFEVSTPPHTDSIFWVISWIDNNGNQYPDSSELIRRPFKYVGIQRWALVDMLWFNNNYAIDMDFPNDTAKGTKYLSSFDNTGLLIDFN